MAAIILTNDDGIDAPGIAALAQAVASITDATVATVAPQSQLSGCGHQVTTRTPIPCDRRSNTAYAIAGTPADCTRLALTELFHQAEWVLSGINAGGNLGIDTYISGTVAAVREASILGKQGIALSHLIQRPLVVDWDVAAQRAARVLAELMAKPAPAGTFWNVNLPHLEPGIPEPELVFCPSSTAPLPMRYRREGEVFHYAGGYSDRDRQAGTDVDVCFGGNIAISQLRL